MARRLRTFVAGSRKWAGNVETTSGPVIQGDLRARRDIVHNYYRGQPEVDISADKPRE